MTQDYYRAFDITKSDTAHLSPVPRALYIGGAGDVAVMPAAGNVSVIFKAVPVGTTLYISVRQVLFTGTSASLIVGLV